MSVYTLNILIFYFLKDVNSILPKYRSKHYLDLRIKIRNTFVVRITFHGENSKFFICVSILRKSWAQVEFSSFRHFQRRLIDTTTACCTHPVSSTPSPSMPWACLALTFPPDSIPKACQSEYKYVIKQNENFHVFFK